MSERSKEIREAIKRWGYAWTLDSNDMERSTLSAEDTQSVVKAALEYAEMVQDDDQLGGEVEIDETYVGGYRKGAKGRKPAPKSTIEPVLTKRANDLGWLASPPTSYPLRFAVEATTEQEARDKFALSLARWEAIGEDRPVKQNPSFTEKG